MSDSPDPGRLTRNVCREFRSRKGSVIDNRIAEPMRCDHPLRTASTMSVVNNPAGLGLDHLPAAEPSEGTGRPVTRILPPLRWQLFNAVD